METLAIIQPANVPLRRTKFRKPNVAICAKTQSKGVHAAIQTRLKLLFDSPTDAFVFFDINASDGITAAEVQRGLRLLGVDASIRDLGGIVSTDGQVSVLGFLRVYGWQDIVDLEELDAMLAKSRLNEAKIRAKSLQRVEALNLGLIVAGNLSDSAGTQDKFNFSALESPVAALDNSGNISRDELFKFMKQEDPSVTEEQVNSLFDLMDRDKDGTVSKSEILHRYTVNRKKFMAVDTDKSGDVDFAELHSFVLHDDETATEEEINLLFESMDRNKDGTVTKNEFSHFYSLYKTEKDSRAYKTDKQSELMKSSTAIVTPGGQVRSPFCDITSQHGDKSKLSAALSPSFDDADTMDLQKDCVHTVWDTLPSRTIANISRAKVQKGKHMMLQV
jgi:Ca2+-binding EF-hand superfamily protein